ncbi:DUF927 domain-containing protein [Sporomusa sphaeroides DSM 2875]|uniref:DUF927 domain-containing protein n=1 Tax=Sporomusa sphaeroides TaxID=47679 RepID=UPI00202DBA4D|nr:DUF927 domain-containing protein [Sporomusa sphaeroides]MCM0759593.1 DUF927 domain-containing protein [Sporomusa sphaeroides DSM 2875]
MDVIQFLKTIFEYAETGYTQVFALPTTQARAVPTTDFSGVPVAIQQFQGQNIYFSPGITGDPKNSKLSEPDIIGIPALWADVDIFHPAHAKPNLPQTVEEAYTLIPKFLPPSIIVHSGHGLQFWWLLRECWMFDTPEEKNRAQDILARLQGLIRQRARDKGWHVDSTQDICRVMRLPGTLNVKIPEQPVWAQVMELSDIRYDPSEIDEILPAIEQTAATTHRTAAFERRTTDGPAAYMLHNCMFMQHCQLNAKTISYGEWLAALTNIVRATDGIEAAHAISAMDPDRYKPADTDKKIDEALGAMNPQNCDYVRGILGFQGCPSGGCGIQAPCGWSLGKTPQARALIRSITVPTAESVYTPEVLQAAAVLEKDAPAEYDQFYHRLSGQVNKNTFRKELSKHKREQSGLTVIEGGAQETPADTNGDRWLINCIPDIPVNLKMPGSSSNYVSWIANERGIKLKRVTDKGESYHEASYAPVFISERIFNIDTKREKAAVTFRNHFGHWQSVVLPKSTIFDAKKIMCLADSGLTINSDMAKNLTKWLSALEASNNSIIPSRAGVAKLGWRNHETEFICPGLNNDYVLDVDDSASQKILGGFGMYGDQELWLNTMSELRKRPKARFILAAAFAAPLLQIVGQRIFCIHNHGDSRDGKTATLHAALSVWGHPSTLKILANSSETGIERTASLCTDLPLGIGELETLDEKRRAEFIDNIIYVLSEGKGRQRATPGGLQESSTWRTLILMNGESGIIQDSTKGGIVTRVLEIYRGPFADDLVFASNLYRITDKNYGHAGRIFLDNLLRSNYTELQQTYDTLRYRLRDKYPNHIDSHLDAAACVALADQLSSMWVFGEDKQTACIGALAAAEHIIEQLITKDVADESERAWQWLQGWIAANDCRFGIHNNGLILGYQEDGYIYVLKTELSKAMKSENLNPDKFYRKWAEQDRIPTTKVGDKRTFAVRGKTIGGVKPWFIKIKAEG